MNGHSTRRFLFSTIGGYGHFHPLVPLARALKEAGHEVAFAAGASLQSPIEAHDFAFFQVGGNLSTDTEWQQFKAQQHEGPTTLESEIANYPWIFAGIGPRLRTPQLVEICRTYQPDMLIREAAEYGALIAAEHLGLPHATISVTASLKSIAIFERDAAPHLDSTRQSWGLPPDPFLAALYHYLHLAFSPPGFALQDVGYPAGSARPIPATTHFVRPEIYDQANTETLPDWVDLLPASGHPTVYVTLGTEVNNEPGLYPDVLQTIIAGLRDLPLNLIVTLGRDKDPSDFGPQPPNVHIERYIPQSLLLPRCDLIVMHGGSNTLLAALDLALPMVVVPLIADQFFNAHVVQSQQLGRTVPLDQLTPASIRTAAQDVLANQAYRENLARLQSEMHSLPDISHAVDLVERVATTRQPQLNPALAPNP